MDSRHGIVVVIPFYNGAAWIERALKSVVAQTVPADEFIVVNDGSHPDERAALGELARRYPFRIVDKENGGQGSARNTGVASSTAPLISFLDQDDFYLPQHNEDLLRVVPNNDPRFGFAYADLVLGDAEGRTQISNLLRTQPEGSHPKTGDIKRIIGTDLFILPSASFIQRSAYEAVGGFDEQFTGYEDDDLFGRLFRASYTNYFLDKPVTVWCQHTGSTSFSIKMSRSRFRYFKKLVASYPDNPTFSSYYLRDYLIPRFERQFVFDVESAIKTNSADLEEVRQILRDYIAVVESNPSVLEAKKMRLRLHGFLLTELRPSTLRLLHRVSYLPVLRDTASFLRR